MIGALFFDKRNPNINKANKVVEKCLQNGLIVVRTGKIIKWAHLLPQEH